MKKKIWAVVLCLMMELTFLPGTFYAEEVGENEIIEEALIEVADEAEEIQLSETGESTYIIAQEIDANSCMWSLDNDGILRISGVGDMEDSFGVESPLCDYADQVESVEIEEGVTSVGAYAFNNFVNLESVQLPASLKVINDGAFIGCSSLQSVDLPVGLQLIGNYAFCGCKKLINVTIPDTVTFIGGWAFEGCEEFTDMVLPDSLTNLQAGLFEGCVNLTSVQLPKTAEWMGATVFSNCVNLTSVSLPVLTKERSIKHSCFYNCTKLEEVFIPGSIESIDSSAFTNCENLTIYGYPGTTAEIFANNKGFPFVAVTEGCDHSKYVTEIKAKSACESVGNIRYWLCQLCGKRFFDADCTDEIEGTDYTIEITGHSEAPPVMENIVYATETEEGSYEEVVYCSFCGKELSRTTKAIEYSPLLDNEVAAGICGIGVFWSLDDNGLLTISGNGSINKFEQVSLVPWYGHKAEITDLTIEEGIIDLGKYAFYECTGLTNVTLPEGLVNTGEYTFYGCTNLESIDLPSTVTTIGKSTFEWCQILPTVEIPSTVTEIGLYAFRHCTNLDGVVLPESLTSLGREAFHGCYGLREIAIPDGITRLGAFTFYDCTSLSNVTFGQGFKAFEGENVFGGCSSLTRITLPDTLEFICNCCFSHSGLEHIDIPDSVTTIEYDAFLACKSLQRANIGAGLKYLMNPFQGCSNLSEITVSQDNCYFTVYDGVLFDIDMTTLYFYPSVKSETVYLIPENVKSIGVGAFDGCVNLKEISMSDNVEELGYQAFTDCIHLNKVRLSEKIKKIDMSFWGCSCLSEINIPKNLERVGYQAFYRCYALKEVTLPETLKVLGPYAFGLCSSLQKITILSKDCEIENNQDVIPDSVEVACYKGSTAETYAINFGRKIYYLDDESAGGFIDDQRIDISQMETSLQRTFTYTGDACTPQVTVKKEDRVFSEGTDFEVEYSNNTNAGTAEAKIIGKGKCSGVIIETFTILPKKITPTVTLSKTSCTYNGKTRTPSVAVKYGEKILAQNTDYEVTYSSGRINAGTYNVTVRLKGNYSGKKTVSFTVKPKKITPAVTLSKSIYTYDGKVHTPSVTVKYGTKTLVKNTDYAVDYSSERKNAGDYNVTVRLKGNYSGKKTVSFTVKPKNITPAVTLSKSKYTYDGKVHTPSVTVKYGTKTLVKNTDYAVDYSSGRKNAGDYNVTVRLKGNYCGKNKVVPFTINKASQKLSIKEPERITIHDPDFYLSLNSKSKHYKCTSSNCNVVSVNNKGKVTINGSGEAIIKVTAVASTNYKQSKSRNIIIKVYPYSLHVVQLQNGTTGIFIDVKDSDYKDEYYIGYLIDGESRAKGTGHFYRNDKPRIVNGLYNGAKVRIKIGKEEGKWDFSELITYYNNPEYNIEY